jgi:dihydroorotate dehydrogenase/Pyruvate/2-oxoacid:ferredoxin oxidoreductase delta subunit
MASLAVNLGGLPLKNPVVMASAPPTETIESIVRCAEHGAAAVVTKTIANFDARSFPLGARRTHVDQRGMWALSTFRRETFDIEAGTALVEGAVRETDIPVIASVGALDMDPEAWLPTCVAVQEAGARMIQLDLFYIPHPRCSPDSVRQLVELLEFLGPRLRIPVAPKLNVELPAHYAAEILAGTPISAAFAIDSLRVPTPLELRNGMRPLTAHVENAAECSLFGGWQKPITLQYTRTLAERLRVPVCAGGGLMTGLDAAEAIMLGATAVQFATAVIQRGHRWISRIIEQLDRYLDESGYADVMNIRGLALAHLGLDERQLRFEPGRAVVNHDLCILCGRCTTQVFCPDIQLRDGRVEVLDHCDGCGLCIAACPTKPKALSFEPLVARS